jgi:small subunit ribosomal protein S1
VYKVSEALRHPSEISDILKKSNDSAPHRFTRLLEDFRPEQPRRGQLIEGSILQVEGDAIFVDIGAKHDAMVPRNEIEKIGPEQFKNLKPGCQLPVYVLKAPRGSGDLLVSIERGLEFEDWNRAETCLASNEVLELEVTGYNRGGLLVLFGKLQGFVPNSHISELRRGMAAEQRESILGEKIGENMFLRVIEVDRRRRRLVLSSRATKKHKRMQRLQELKPDQVLDGQVVELVDFGAFVDLGDVDGLVHISELAWHRVAHPSEVMKIGDTVTVQVKAVDMERERISLSRKSLIPGPWDSVRENYFLGEFVEGTVANVLNFGAFVFFQDGIEGLIYKDEMDLVGTDRPRDILSPGESVVVRIVDINPERKRMSLSLRPATDEGEAAWIRKEQENTEAIEKGIIKDLSLLGAVHDSLSQRSPSETDVSGPCSSS